MHAKYAVIDGQRSIIGSPNLNSRSRELDEENAFGISDRPSRFDLRQQWKMIRGFFQQRMIPHDFATHQIPL